MNKLARWRQTRIGFLVLGAIELALAYAFASLAIDRGSWWWYALTLVFLVGGLRNVIELAGKVLNRGKTRRAR